MKTTLVRLPSYADELTKEAEEAIQLLNGVWREATNLFLADTDSSIKRKKKPPLGIQKYLNEIIDERFIQNDWDGEDSRFIKKETWIRVTFRHQMSLGSDFLDALRLIKTEKINQCILLAADEDFLKLITPRDWRSICSFQKVSALAAQLEKPFPSPIIIGELKPESKISQRAHELVYGLRLQGK